MNTINFKGAEIAIEFIDTNAAVAALASSLSQKKAIAFDTEFDRFWREYGFKLFLLQIFDGEKCYLIDPLAKINLQPIWAIFEDETICKVAYSTSEDIQILKINNCHTKNIFDVQVAAKLCNNAANSYSDLITQTFGVAVDKSMQKSNWRTRPLPAAQQIYAANDVVWLLHFYDNFYKTAIDAGVYYMLEEENKYCETVEVNEYKVKLTSKQIFKYDKPEQAFLLRLMHVRNMVAQGYNMPPANVCSDITLEEIVDNKAAFLQHPFSKGFTKRIIDDNINTNLFMHALENNYQKIEIFVNEKRTTPYIAKIILRGDEKDAMIKKVEKITAAIVTKYGQICGEFIARGLKKAVLEMPYEKIKLRKYQHKIIEETCQNLQIML